MFAAMQRCERGVKLGLWKLSKFRRWIFESQPRFRRLPRRSEGHWEPRPSLFGATSTPAGEKTVCKKLYLGGYAGPQTSDGAIKLWYQSTYPLSTWPCSSTFHSTSFPSCSSHSPRSIESAVLAFAAKEPTYILPRATTTTNLSLSRS